MEASKVLGLVEEIIYVTISPMNAGFIVLLNIMQIAYIVSTKMENSLSSTPYFLNLSVCDLISGIMLFTNKGSKSLVKVTKGGAANNIVRFIDGSILNISCIVSVLTLTMLTIDRLLVVLKPCQYKNFKLGTRKLICFGFWLLAIANAVINYFRVPGNTIFNNKQDIFVALFALAGIPFPIISYILIKRVLKNSQSLSSDEIIIPVNEVEHRSLNLCTKTFIIYTVFWIPYIIYAVLDWYEVLGIAGKFVRGVAIVIVFINSSVKPIAFFQHFQVYRVIKDKFAKQPTNKTTRKDTAGRNVV